MKTRDLIYHREGEKLLRFLTTYHALKYEQVMKMFGNQDSIKSLITSLVKQGRIYHDKEAGLLCDSPEAAKNPDRGTIAAFWVLLDFEKPIVFHTSGDFPVKLHFFSENTIVIKAAGRLIEYKKVFAANHRYRNCQSLLLAS